MSIGDALAQARSQAGLTLAQVSERTRIRETIVRGIEHDDFSACGGDFYARGHIRSIARVVGVDSEPLIHDYDTTHGAPQAIRAADVFEPATPIKLKERRRPNWSLAMIVVLALLVGYGVYRAVAAVASPGGHTPVAAPLSHHSSAAAARSRPASQSGPRCCGASAALASNSSRLTVEYTPGARCAVSYSWISCSGSVPTALAMLRMWPRA